MFEVVIKSVITFLVIYGMADIVSRIIKAFFAPEHNDVFVFIHVKNQEDNIEYAVRTAILNFLHSYGGRTVPYVIIVDKGSTDKTKEISERLCNDYDFLYYTTYEKYEEFKKQIE